MSRRLPELSSRTSGQRNVHLYNHDGEVLGGIYQNGSLKQQHLYRMCRIFLDVSSPGTAWSIFELRADASTGNRLIANNQDVEPGRYVVLKPARWHSYLRAPYRGVFPASNLVADWEYRHHSKNTSYQKRAYFRNKVRQRDGYCMISGTENPDEDYDQYIGFDVAHIFPFAREADWRSNNFMRFIRGHTSASLIGSSKIHSPQNGILLSSRIHALFDTFRVSVNPDDNYRVTAFRRDTDGVDGRVLEARCRNPADPDRVSDDLLRWHFRMSVLANMRGDAAEPDWEYDFPEGDMMGEIREGPYAAERMELELIDRLGYGEGVC